MTPKIGWPALEEAPVPWKEITSVDERVRFIAEYNEQETSFSSLCERFGISRKTGYKWLERYEKLGPGGLADRTCAPTNCPHATPAEMVEVIVELRKDKPTWGPKKVKARLEAMGIDNVPAASTIGVLLKSHGLIRPRRRRVYPPALPASLAEAVLPNDTWCIDFKGHFALGDKTRCHPLTLTDQVSRYLLKCEGLTKTDGAAVRPHLDRAFREFGLPRRIRSDNGAPFATLGPGGLSALSVEWIKLGIEPERIEPAHPEQNGRHERMHRTLKQETASPSSSNLRDQQSAFDRFRHVYNDERPHEALAMRPPAKAYSSSPRVMPAQPSSPEYPEGYVVRRLTEKGDLRFKGEEIHVLKLLGHEPVGILPVDEDVWELYYGTVLLAELRIKDKKLCIEKLR